MAAKSPPRLPRAAGGLSGRPFCRIYWHRHVWVLEIDSASGGWMDPEPSLHDRSEPDGLTFPTLSAAIAYAEQHGLDYRIERPPRQRYPAAIDRGRTASGLPRSWQARLARNGRSGEIYDG
jgi:hypothetical protein